MEKGIQSGFGVPRSYRLKGKNVLGGMFGPRPNSFALPGQIAMAAACGSSRGVSQHLGVMQTTRGELLKSRHC